VDLNRNHLCVLRLKLAALQYLPSYEDFFLFFGNAKDERNQENYFTYLSEHLDDDTREFWEGGSIFRKMTVGSRISYFEKNFYNFAKTGYYLRFLTFIAWTCRRDPKKLLSATSREEQEQIFEESIAPFFDNWFVRSAGKNPVMLYSLGIPPQQFNEMQKESGSGLISMYRDRIKKMACDFPIEDNYFGWQALSRGYDPARKAIPDYLKEENFETLRTNLHRVSVQNITLLGYMKTQPDKSLDRFVFLDSQDWMKPEMIQEMWLEITRVGKPGTRIIFRTAASQSPVETALSPELKKRFEYKEQQSRELLAEDRSAIYGGFHLYVMKE
jgi:S-adenosylmethionine-diacylglycerol 3-amino-3-carboxypropyl transferase